MRIGITMRTAKESAYPEVRDALDRAWWPFLDKALPGDTFVPLPNSPSASMALFAELGLEGLVLTGGDDVGSSSERDETESLLVESCLERGLPVLGVCRGLQFLAWKFGSAGLVRCDAAFHVAKRHMVSTTPSILPFPVFAEKSTNSYHGWAATLPEGSPLRTWARAEDGTVEGLFDPRRRLLALGWHPEREEVPDISDVDIFRQHFHGGSR